jgi:uncharacterized membrane protein HdeD (DUF308 family)
VARPAPPTLREEVRRNATPMILLGVVLLLLGALALSAPFWEGIAAALGVGCLVLAAGIAQCFFALQSGRASQRLLGLLAGILTALCGVVMIAHPLLNLGFLTLALAAYFAVAGVFEGVQALRLRPLGGWDWVGAGALLSLALAAMIWKQWPFSGDWAVAVYIGVKVMVLGATMVVLGRAARTAQTERDPRG